MAQESVQYLLSLRDQMSATLTQVTQKVGQLESRLSGVQKTADNTSSVFKKGAALIGGYFAVNEVIQFGKSTIDALTNYEFFQSTLNTLLGGNKQAVKELTSELETFATTTPFKLTDLQKATTSLLAFGEESKNITSTLERLGNIASPLRIPIDEMAQMIGKMKVQNKVMGDDLKQLGGRGINVIEPLAAQFGVTTEAVSELASKGKIKFADLEKAMKSLTAEGSNFFGLMDDQSLTTGGQINNLGDKFDAFKLKLGLALKPVIVGIVQTLDKLMAKISDLMNYISRNSTLFKGLAITIGTAVAGYQLYMLTMKSATIATNLMAIAQKALNVIMSLNPIGLIVAGIAALTAAFIYLWNTCDEFQAFFYGLWGAMKAIFQNIAQLGIDVFGGLADIIKGVISFDPDSLFSGVDKLKNSFSDFGGKVADGFRKGFDDRMGVLSVKSEVDATKGKILPKKTTASAASEGKKAKDIAGNSKPTNINITINKLTGIDKVETSTMELSIEKMKKVVTEMILTAVNNANIIATGG